VTDVANPVEIGLTSHIGEAHTVNVDPKRPHIAFAVTSDSVTVDCNPDRTSCTRRNEDPTSSQRFNLDGFEVVDYSSCLNFPPGTTAAQKRAACRPKVYRYQYPDLFMALGHTADALAGCHELEIYPDDKLTCASINATLFFDVSGAFDDNGTPTNYADDKPRGTPLPCRLRPSSTLATQLWYSGAMVTDCVFDASGGELTIPRWKTELGAPSLDGVRFLGSAFHQGRGAPHSSKEDVDVSHEAELTHSGKFILTTDERGGGVTPPGASCAPVVDNPQGNGGIHAYAVDRLLPRAPDTAEAAWASYARTPEGAKAIYRAPIHTGPEGSLCTSHVFHQIPGQNRIFMGWYSQGTQVVDYVEHPGGTIEFKSAGWFIPENANTWVSHVFKFQQNPDCTFTYWGATGDFNLGAAGRSAIDVYKVTLPAPPNVSCTPAPTPAMPGAPPPPQPPAPRAPAAGPCTIAGTAGNDRLVGTPRPDVICGRGGNDVILGLGGADRLYGGAGSDRLLGGAGADRLYGGAAADRLEGGAGPDLVAGDGGNDRLFAGAGRNRLLGKQGRDLLWARNGVRDRVAGGSGRDRAVLDRVDLVRYVEQLVKR
jgi:Ca2+-binding RTX toxin-like protein